MAVVALAPGLSQADRYVGEPSEKPYYFPTAPMLPRKLVSANGALFERLETFPNLGTVVKAPNGLIWTSTLAAAAKEFDGTYQGAIMEAYGLPTGSYNEDHDFCERHGARLPTVGEYEDLRKLLTDSSGKFVPLTQDGRPLMDVWKRPIDERPYNPDFYVRQPYLTVGNEPASTTGWLYDFYGQGRTYKTDRGHGLIRCVLSPEMQTPVNYKAKYDSMVVPKVTSCDPKQFVGEWTSDQIACYLPQAETFRLVTRRPFTLNIKQRLDRPDLEDETKPLSSGKIFVDGLRINGMLKYYAAYLVPRKDGLGCDVLYSTQAVPKTTLMTISKDRKSDTIVIRSNTPKVSFCGGAPDGMEIQQIMSLRSKKKESR